MHELSPVFTFTFLSVLNANGKVKKYSHSPLVRNNLSRKVWRPGKNQARAELHRPGQTTISVTWPSLELWQNMLFLELTEQFSWSWFCLGIPNFSKYLFYQLQPYVPSVRIFWRKKVLILLAGFISKTWDGLSFSKATPTELWAKLIWNLLRQSFWNQIMNAFVLYIIKLLRYIKEILFHLSMLLKTQCINCF